LGTRSSLEKVKRAAGVVTAPFVLFAISASTSLQKKAGNFGQPFSEAFPFPI